MKAMLLRVGLVLGGLLILGGTAYAAWTQGEAAGYGKGYADGVKAEQLLGAPRLTGDEAVGLAKAYVQAKKLINYVHACDWWARYTSGGLWAINSLQKAQSRPYAGDSCPGYTFTVNDRTGNVTGP